jgi:hypothetical protein
MSGYRVAIKPSARRTNGAVGQFVHTEGAHTVFPDRPAADRWASQLSTEGERMVWIRDANPCDTDADGYLMGRSRDREE